MNNVIPGVPVAGDPTCVLTVCGKIIAQVDCIKYILQGTYACIDIQFFNENQELLDLDDYHNIQVQLTNELECVVVNYWYPTVPTGSTGFIIEILQHTLTDGRVMNKGLLRLCLSNECTLTSPSLIFAEILLYKQAEINTGSQLFQSNDAFGIPCLQVAKIIESKIAKNGGTGGCSPS
jgi:hypothetical protein